jgi:hypothetical protein
MVRQAAGGYRKGIVGRFTGKASGPSGRANTSGNACGPNGVASTGAIPHPSGC